jgi:hypothetical protein
MWIEISLELVQDRVRVTALGSRMERPKPHLLGPTLEELERFATKVERAVSVGKALDAAGVEEAKRLHEAVFAGEVRDVLTSLGAVAPEGKLLVRLMIRERALQTIPWEALCRPGTNEGFLAGAPDLLLTRGVSSKKAWTPLDIAIRPVNAYQ